jgi:hypothetical protein
VGKVTLSGDTVSMSAEYWLLVTKYVIDTEAGITIYEGIK